MSERRPRFSLLEPPAPEQREKYRWEFGVIAEAMEDSFVYTPEEQDRIVAICCRRPVKSREDWCPLHPLEREHFIGQVTHAARYYRALRREWSKQPRSKRGRPEKRYLREYLQRLEWASPLLSYTGAVSESEDGLVGHFVDLVKACSQPLMSEEEQTELWRYVRNTWLDSESYKDYGEDRERLRQWERDHLRPKTQQELERLVADHQWLVGLTARRFRERGTDDDELDHVGQIALWEAAAKYDDNRGAKFSTYAAKLMLKRMTDCVSTNRPEQEVIGEVALAEGLKVRDLKQTDLEIVAEAQMEAQSAALADLVSERLKTAGLSDDEWQVVRRHREFMGVETYADIAASVGKSATWLGQVGQRLRYRLRPVLEPLLEQQPSDSPLSTVWGWDFQSEDELRQAMEDYATDRVGLGVNPLADSLPSEVERLRPDAAFRQYQRNRAIDDALALLLIEGHLDERRLVDRYLHGERGTALDGAISALYRAHKKGGCK